MYGVPAARGRRSSVARALSCNVSWVSMIHNMIHSVQFASKNKTLKRITRVHRPETEQTLREDCLSGRLTKWSL